MPQITLSHRQMHKTESLDNSQSRCDVYAASSICSYCSSTYFVSVDHTVFFDGL